MLAVRLDEETEGRLERLAAKTGRTKTFYARAAIVAHLDDLEDFYLAEERLRDFRDGDAIPLSTLRPSLVWQLKFLPAAAKELRELDRNVAARIIKTLEERIAPLDDTRTVGGVLVDEHAGYRRWRIGDYRVVARIEDERITVLGVRVAHWREVCG